MMYRIHIIADMFTKIDKRNGRRVHDPDPLCVYPPPHCIDLVRGVREVCGARWWGVGVTRARRRLVCVCPVMSQLFWRVYTAAYVLRHFQRIRHFDPTS